MIRTRRPRWWTAAIAALCLVAATSAIALDIGRAKPARQACSLSIGGELQAEPSGDLTNESVNCFAWQTFIALNWPYDPAHRGAPAPDNDQEDLKHSFGQPNSPGTLTVWQTYRRIVDVFPPPTATPVVWGDSDPIPSRCAPAYFAWLDRADRNTMPIVLRLISKFGDPQPGDTLENFVQASHHILIDQKNHIVRYEGRINEDGYQYIVDHKLYDADQQYTMAIAPPHGLNLPPNNDAKTTIEVKAAWREIAGQSDNIIGRYKTAEAFIYDHLADTCSATPVLMGLVGLHIVRKTETLLEYMWATFEHVDNVPPRVEPVDTPIPYSLYNPKCEAPAPCTPNATPIPTNAPSPSSTGTPSPSPTGTPSSTPTLVPAQVARVFPIPTEVQLLNIDAHATIRSANPGSVWQYYQLVNASWPGRSFYRLPRATVPIEIGPFQFKSTGPTPTMPSVAAGTPTLTAIPFQPVTNVSMETFVQDRDCTTCHRNAPVAVSIAAGCQPRLASDFSFMFRHARPWSGSVSCPADIPAPATGAP